MPIEQHILEQLRANDSSLIELDLNDRGLVADDILILVEALKTNTNLKKLFLSKNIIGNEGAKALAAITTDIHLVLHHCRIHAEGAKALATNPVFTSLDLAGINQIQNDGLKALAANKTLTSLLVHENLNFSNEGAQELLNNQTLTYLTIFKTRVSQDLQDKIQAQINSNKELAELHKKLELENSRADYLALQKKSENEAEQYQQKILKLEKRLEDSAEEQEKLDQMILYYEKAYYDQATVIKQQSDMLAQNEKKLQEQGNNINAKQNKIEKQKEKLKELKKVNQTLLNRYEELNKKYHELLLSITPEDQCDAQSIDSPQWREPEAISDSSSGAGAWIRNFFLEEQRRISLPLNEMHLAIDEHSPEGKQTL